MPESREKLPRKLKKLESSDILTVKDNNDDLYVVTKQEVARVIREFITNEIGNLPDEISERHKKDLASKINSKMEILEKELVTFIDYRFDTIAEKACEMLLSRKFTEEVNKRVDERIEKIILKKQAKGKF